MNYLYFEPFVRLPANPNVYVDRGPWFLRFGFLFLFTTVASLLALSYLGLYGTFLVNIIPLFLFWASSLHFFNKIFFEKITYFVNVGK
jgi:hypothetical protein